MSVKAVKAWKEKSIFYVQIDDKPKPITYDLATKTLTSYTGRVLKTNPKINNNWELSKAEQLIVEAIQCRRHMLDKLDIWLSYPDLLETARSLHDLPEKCPKGFVNWLKENDKTLSSCSLNKFLQEKAEKAFTKQDKEIYNILKSIRYFSYELIRYYSELSPKVRKTVNKILNITFKIPMIWNLKSEIENLLKLASTSLGIRVWIYNRDDESFFASTDVTEYLDPNRDIEHNINNIKALIDKIKEKSIIKNENKIRKIEELSNDEFKIIVPTCLEDFINEGKMQNNCVGSYYYDNIASGTDYIYFIRKADTPDKSYITNRFNVSQSITCETKMKNNAPNADRNAMALINEIDLMIKILLK